MTPRGGELEVRSEGVRTGKAINRREDYPIVEMRLMVVKSLSMVSGLDGP